MHTSSFVRRVGVRGLPGAIALATTVFLIKAVFLATAPLRGLGMTSWIIDDTFIIMRVARNVALGHGFSYDFTHATTGAPPLWTYITSVNHLLPSFEWALRITFIETTLFASLATLVVFLLARKIAGEYAAWTAFLLATFTGNAFFEAMNGMDTSLFTLTAVASMAMYAGVFRPSRWSDATWAAATGAMIGLTCLLRGDGIFVLGAIGLIELIGIAKTKTHRISKLKNLSMLTAIALLCIAMLIGWQLIRTGTPFLGNQVGRRELAMSLHGFSFDHFVTATYLKIVGWNVFQLEKLVTIATGSSLLALAALGAGLFKKERRVLAAVTGVYMTAFFCALVAYQWYFPDLHGLRYINPAVHLLFVFVGALFADLFVGTWGRRFLSVFVATVIVLSNYAFYDLVTHLVWEDGMTFTAHPSPEAEKNTWATIDWVTKNLPKDSVIGVRDHGRFALFTDRPTQDLAGNIDPRIPLLARTSGLKEYLKNVGLDYVLIPSLETRKDLIYQVLFKDLKLEKVVDAPGYRDTYLYKVIW